MTLALENFIGHKNCRTYVVPACEPTQQTSSAVIPNAAAFQIRKRDTLDYSVDLRSFLTAISSDIALANVAFTIGSATTSAGAPTGNPTIAGSGFDPAGIASLVMTPHASANVGDIYTIDMVATTTPTGLPGGGQLPARSITRRMAFTVVAG